MLKHLWDRLNEMMGTQRLSGAIIGFVFFLATVLFGLTEAYNVFELKLYDLRFKIKPEIAQWEYLSFLDIDDNSINTVGEFPWSRNVYGRGLDVLKSVGIRQVAFDIQFPDESPKVVKREALEKLRARAEAHGAIPAGELADIVTDSDKALATAVRTTRRVIVPFSFLKDRLSDRTHDEKRKRELKKAREQFLEKASIRISEASLAEFRHMVDPDRIDIYLPIPEFIRAAETFGFVDSDFDIDGTSRRIRLVRVLDGRLFFHMGLAMVMDLCGVAKENVVVTPGKSIVLKNAVHPATQVRGDITIPIDRTGMLYIHWAGDLEKTFDHVSFSALLEYNSLRGETQLKDEIHKYLDDMEQKSGSFERSKLYGELDDKYAEYAKTADPAKRRELWDRIGQIRHKIRDIEGGYQKAVEDELAKLTADPNYKTNAQLKEQAEGVRNYLAAVKLVREVDNLRDHSAVIGLTATGTQDIGITPLSSQYMMVGTYPNIVNTILSGSYIRKLNYPTLLLLMLVLAVAGAMVIQRLTARNSVLVILGAFILVNAVITLAMLGNIWIDQLGINLSMLLPSVIIAGIKFVREENQRKFIKQAFSSYLSPHVIEQIIKDPSAMQLGGVNRDITIFFSDVAKFSTISEKLSPTELVQLMNEYLSAMTDVILGLDGTVDKFEGDAIMAFYGAPQYYTDHAKKACLAAIEMQRLLVDMRAVWRKQGRNELYVRMGMNSGDATVGNMGSRQRMNYTVMGDAVNLASRLEGANKFYGTYTMISETTYQAAVDVIQARPLDLIRVVGKEQPIKVYELMGAKGGLEPDILDMLAKYNEGMAAFEEHDWKRARSCFRAGLNVIETDGPCSTYYKRCQEFIDKPPSRNWDGVYTLKSK